MWSARAIWIIQYQLAAVGLTVWLDIEQLLGAAHCAEIMAALSLLVLWQT
jgi:hypothetical protein